MIGWGCRSRDAGECVAPAANRRPETPVHSTASRMEIDRRGIHRGHHAGGRRDGRGQASPRGDRQPGAGDRAGDPPPRPPDRPADRSPDPALAQAAAAVPEVPGRSAVRAAPGGRRADRRAAPHHLGSRAPRPDRRGDRRRTSRSSRAASRASSGDHAPRPEAAGTGHRDLPEDGAGGRQEQEGARPGPDDRLPGHGHRVGGEEEGTGLRHRLRPAGDRQLDEGPRAARGSTRSDDRGVDGPSREDRRSETTPT